MIDLLQLSAYVGPNICGPQAGVLVRVRSPRDCRPRLRAALKDGAQFIGLVIAGIGLEAEALADGQWLVQAFFVTNLPSLAAELAAYVIAGMRAELTGDEEWDRDTPLFDLQARRREIATPVSLLQLQAEARARQIPAFFLPDGRLQIGYGARGVTCLPDAPAPAWADLGAVPLIAVSGSLALRCAWVAAEAERLRAAGYAVRCAPSADAAACYALLCDPQAEALVIGLDDHALLAEGLAFDRCTRAVIVGLAGERPALARDDHEWALAVGLPMLLAAEPAYFNPTDPRLAVLLPYAPHGVVLLPILSNEVR